MLYELFPIMAVCVIQFKIQWYIVLVYFFIGQSFYSIGYAWNDIRDRNIAKELDRIEARTIHMSSLTTYNVLYAFIGIVTLVFLGSLRAALICLFMSLFLLLLLILHSSSLVRHIRGMRIVTFSVLAVFRYAPVLLPAVGMRSGMFCLISIFMIYGQARVVIYALRKYGMLLDTVSVPLQAKIQGSILLFAVPLLFLFSTFLDRTNFQSLLILITSYGASWLLLIAGGKLRRIKILSQYGNKQLK
jgi:4-hydroxybenzoate polyprenyltransferase